MRAGLSIEVSPQRISYLKLSSQGIYTDELGLVVKVRIEKNERERSMWLWWW